MNSYLESEEMQHRLATVLPFALPSVKSAYGQVPFGDMPALERAKCLLLASALSNNINWEFLCTHTIPKIYTITNGFAPHSVFALTVDAFFACFSGYNKPEKIDAANRYDMLLTTTQEMLPEPNAFCQRMLNCESAHGAAGLSSLLSRLTVFSEDPVKKKNNLLIQLLVRSGLLHVNDEIDIEPAIDYHVIRVYLRTGRIIPSDENIAHRLRARLPFTTSETTELRSAIRDAMRRFCLRNNVHMTDLCLFDWILGRTYCDRDSPVCAHDRSACPASPACASACLPIPAMLTEPHSTARFY